MAGKNERTFTLMGEVKSITDDAICLEHDPESEAIWIPKSQVLDCDEEVTDLTLGMAIELEIPYWLAEHEGLA